MKRIGLVLLSFLFCCTLLSAGGAQEKGPVSLLWWSHYGSGTGPGDYMGVYLKKFAEKYPDIKVELNQAEHKDYINALPTAIATGQAPDAFAMTYRYIPTYHENHSVDPIGKVALKEFGADSIAELKKQWAPNALDDYSAGGNYYGLPFEYNIYAWGINNLHFKQAGLDPDADAPKTWDDLIRVGKKLVIKEGGRIKREAVSFPFTLSAAWYLLEFEQMVRELGSSIMNADQSECIVNNEAGIKAMQELKRRFDESISDKDLSNASDYHVTAFPNGQFSMTIMANWGMPRWYDKKNFPNNNRGDFKAIPTPTFSGRNTVASTTSWAWCVYSGSSHKAEAWRLANFLTSFPSENITKVGNVLPRAGWSATEGAKTIPQAEFFEEMLKYAAPLAAYRKYGVSEPLKRMMQEVLLSGRDIKASLDKVKAEIDKAIKD